MITFTKYLRPAPLPTASLAEFEVGPSDCHLTVSWSRIA